MATAKRNWCLLALSSALLTAAGTVPDPTTQLSQDLKSLARMNVTKSADYWTTHAVKGRQCEGQAVAGLIVSIANALEPVDSFEKAIVILTRRKIIWNDYWADNAVAGRKCDGQYVANLIHAAAEPLDEVKLVADAQVPAGVIATAEPSAFNLPDAKSGPDRFNYIVGTQTFGAAYQFTRKHRLVETAEAIAELGCTVLKFELAPNYTRRPGYTAAAAPPIHSLADLARHEPAHRHVLDMPFAHFVIWAHTFHGGEHRWHQGFSKVDQEAEYRELYDLTAHLLRTYSDSDKTFYLGHWEGDGFLRGNVAAENDANVTPSAVQGMADWLNTRQRAVDEAKRDTPHSRVAVWHYTEVNHVKLAMLGRPALVNTVLPKTTVDLVSYSCYDTAFNPALLKAALAYIESKLPPKPGLTGRRVFIGEYGFPAVNHTPAEQDLLSRAVIQAGLEWGCPLVLYWEMYNNEVDDRGRQRGFWLIDDKGVKQPIYATHHQFFAWGREYVAGHVRAHGRVPTTTEFRKVAVRALDREKSR
jgi:hypothetical protein